MYWYRLEVSLGRNSIVGTTVRQGALPEHLLADEHHQTLDGDKVYIATTVAEGCCLGAAQSATARQSLRVAEKLIRVASRVTNPITQGENPSRVSPNSTSVGW